MFPVLNLPITIGPISIESIKSKPPVSRELFKLQQALVTITKKRKKAKQVGVYVIYVKPDILYVGATRNFKQRVSHHKAALSSYRGHVNTSLQTCYNQIKQETNFSHYQILDDYFQFIPLFCYEINGDAKANEAGRTLDFIIQRLEAKVTQAFAETGKFTIVNIGPMLTQEAPVTLPKEEYYRKLGDLAAAEVLRLQDGVARDVDISSFSAQQQKDLLNASRKIRPVISMKTGQFFVSYRQICGFQGNDEDLVSLRARSDNPGLNGELRDLRFAENQEIIAQKYIACYDYVENPGVFNRQTTTFAKKSGIIGPELTNQTDLPAIKKICYSCTTPKKYYESLVAASFSAKVSSKAISQWINRDDTLYKEFNMPIIWRKATSHENKVQSYLAQSQDGVPRDYDFSLENTKRIKTHASAYRAQKALIGLDKEKFQPKFFSSSKQARDYYNVSDNWLKMQMKESELAFLESKLPRKFRTASLEEINRQCYLKKYDTLRLEKILEGLPKEKYKNDANITRF